MTLLWFALLVGVLITVHELGHFCAARLLGVRVLKMSIGFGHPLLRFRRQQTEYSVGVVPLGGYVRLLGEESSAEVSLDEQPHAFSARPPWQRLLVIFAGPLANLIFASLVFMQLANGEPGAATATIGTVFAGQPAAEADLHPGDRVVAVDGDAVANWDEFNRRVLRSAGHELRVTVERPGARGEPVRPLTKYLLPRLHRRTDAFGGREQVGLVGVAPYFKLPQIGVIDPESPAYKAGLRTFDIVTSVHGRPVATQSDLAPLLHPHGGGMLVVTYLHPVGDALGFLPLSRLEPRSTQVVPANRNPPGRPPRYDAGVRPADLFVRAVEEETPAAAIGLRSGDEVMALDGQPLDSWELLQQALEEHPNEEHAIDWRSPSAPESRHAVFRLERRRKLDEYQTESTYYLFGAWGARAVDPVPSLPPRRNLALAVGAGIARAASVTGTMIHVLALTLVGRLPATAIGGPILVYQVAGVAAQHGLDHFLAVAALISLNLGLLNLLPVPLLDGGQASFVIFEALRRRPVSERARERATLIGMALLVALMLIALRNDLMRHLSVWWR